MAKAMQGSGWLYSLPSLPRWCALTTLVGALPDGAPINRLPLDGTFEKLVTLAIMASV
jgi:hypothetical protein